MGLAAVGLLWVWINVGTLKGLWWERQPLERLKSIAERPDADPLARRVYTRRLVRLGRADDAVGLLRGLVQELPPGASGSEAQSRFAELAHALAVTGQVDDAKAARDRARAIQPNDPLLILTDAWLDTIEGRYDLAKKNASGVAELRPSDPEPWRLLGVIGNASRKPETAQKPLRRAIELGPDVAASHAELGHALAGTGRFAEAVAAFRKACALNPGSVEYRKVLGDALSLSARTPAEYAEARKLLEDALAASPDDPELTYTLAQVEVRSHALTRALPRLRAALAANPRIHEALYLLTYVERRLGNARAADADQTAFFDYDRIEERVILAQNRVLQSPTDAARRVELARSYAAARNPVGAYAQLRVALRLRPGLSVPERSAIVAAYRAHRVTPDDARLVGPSAPGSPPNEPLPWSPP